MDRLRLVFTSGKGNSIVSWMIKKFSGGDVSHVGIQDGGIIYSAEQEGVIEHSLDHFLKGRQSIYIFEATEEGAKHLDLDRAKVHLGTKYGFTEWPGFVIASAAEALGTKIKNPFGDKDASMVCSEFALYLDGDGLIPEFDGLDPETTTPVQMVKALLKGGPTFNCIYNAHK